MANKVLLKKSSVSAKVPLTTDLDYGELALNYADGKLYFKNSGNSIQSFGSTSYIRVTSNTTAVAGKSYLCDTSGGTFTLTLPASPATGDTVIIADGASFSTTALTVGRNSSTIESVADDLSINIGGVHVTLTYDGTTWQVYTQVGANGGTEVTLSGSQTLTNKTISGSGSSLSGIGASSFSGVVTITDSTATSSTSSGSLVLSGGLGIAGGITAGGSIVLTNAGGANIGTVSSSATLLNANASTISFAGAATTLNIGASSGTTTVNNMLKINYTGSSESSLQITGNNTKGGAGYHDFLKVTNTGQTNPNKFLRLNSTGTLELINSAYNATLLSITDGGLLTIPGTASVTNNTATTNGINVGTHGTVFDDGNFHVHSTSGALWLNANDGSDIIVGTQTNSGTSRLAANNFVLDAGYGSRAPVYGVRAWINCGYVGSTMTTRASGNLSVSRTGVGVYVFTFGSAMPDRNYSINCTAQTPTTNSDVAANIAYNVTPSTTGFTIHTARYGTGQVDVSELHVQVVR